MIFCGSLQTCLNHRQLRRKEERESLRVQASSRPRKEGNAPLAKAVKIRLQNRLAKQDNSLLGNNGNQARRFWQD